MDYKKAYKQALERAKAFNKRWQCSIQTIDSELALKELKEIFPELKENNDEEIRKALINVFATHKDYEMFFGVSVEDIHAWLEKQREYKSIQNEEDEKIRKGIISGMKALQEKGKYTCFANIPMDDVFAWLERQGEQKPNPYTGTSFEYNGHTWGMCARDNGVEIGFDGELKAFLSSEKSFIYPIHPQPVLEPIKEENVGNNNKVEPKFKVGDWITNGDYTWKIVDVKPLDYILQSQDDNIVDDTISHVDEQFNLWTIQDAKDGDVLAFDNDTIVIFKDLYNSTTFHSYCHIEDGVFDVSKDVLPDWWEGKGFYPATKEQRDLLSQKMKEAGYEWDAEKKELKLLITNGGDFFESEDCEQKTAWSEEDEQMIGRIRGIVEKYAFSQSAVDVNGDLCEKEYIEADNWLKSLIPQNH